MKSELTKKAMRSPSLWFRQLWEIIRLPLLFFGRLISYTALATLILSLIAFCAIDSNELAEMSIVDIQASLIQIARLGHTAAWLTVLFQLWQLMDREDGIRTVFSRQAEYRLGRIKKEEALRASILEVLKEAGLVDDE